ncbi:hypothetical protein COT94_03720 [Candidatus Falkowbacteria bacterium CG10_big_fil_rev_8_21_14_0_10_37_14]|uniref:AI-2E family transporter n=1 Tax=Candidatus Falkowbacteria bacterium CG10_big_fil_rev_8_21_14_0_10_37_14 TaxID=1974561 RepID=A0A2M6WSR3_9BACT|nr:AI-2E family transporter [Candidatus Falkowbacteria bacterium]PIT95840.1 MAG: hypothetical protein COT94_03720 [Candidatus Falkowbacteria bacterium CG10_big_fil_rev_8_21_14_0_10_37_14]
MANSNNNLSLSISIGTIIKIVALAVALYLLYLITDVLILLFASVVFASAINPWVDWLETKKIPRILSVLIIYLVGLSLLVGTIYLIIPPIATQTAEMANNWPTYLNKTRKWTNSIDSLTGGFPSTTNIENILQSLGSNLQLVSGGLLQALSNIFNGLSAFLLILVITFYIVTEKESVNNLILAISPVKKHKHLIILFANIQKKIGYWLSGQLFLCLVIFIFTYISLSILGVKYALVLAIIAGITEAIPYLGPIAASVPGIFLAFIQSPILAVFVAIAYLLIQQIENSILVPMVMRKAVGINPIISISVLMIGFKLGGVLGALIAIPVATTANVIIQDWRAYRKKIKAT